MEKIWLDSYPPNVPHEIGTLTYSSINEFFIQSCKLYADRPALRNFGSTLTYTQLHQYAHQFAAFLQNEWQLQKGDRLAIMLPNTFQYYIAIFGALLAGLTIVNVNPLYKPRELVHQLLDSGAKAIIVFANVANVLAECIEETAVKYVCVTKLGDLFPPRKAYIFNAIMKLKQMVPKYNLPAAIHFKFALHKGKKSEYKFVELTQDDVAFLQYTGGTTGIPKGAMLTHGNILANTEQAYVWFEHLLENGAETILAALPLYHIFSLTVCCFISVKIGARALVITNPRDLNTFIKELHYQKTTVFVGINTLYNLLMNHTKFSKLDFSKLKLAIAGGMAVQKPIAEKWQKYTGKVILEGYGLTEASPIISINPVVIPNFIGSIGLPVPSTDICLIDEQDNFCASNSVGQLCVKGPQVMKGYWQQEEETKKAFLNNEWLRTGDIARIDEKGFIYIVDRKKDMILVSGFNVYPNEIEEIVAMHPGVLEVACIGVPDERTGEAVKVFIVKKDPNLTEADIRKFCTGYLTGYKRPTHIEFRESLPKSPVGKILRRELRDNARV